MNEKASALERVLLGTAVGDSIGLPAEGLSAERIRRQWTGRWRHRFLFGRGMVSDDTEHTVFVAQCLAENAPDPKVFARKLGWKLRWWLLCVPAGIGFATLRAILKLWLGFPPSRSGVFSAGNGPAMRSAIIGAYFAQDRNRLCEYVQASTRLTHSDPKAEAAALAVALTAAWAISRPTPPEKAKEELQQLWIEAGSDEPTWDGLIKGIFVAYDRQSSVAEFAASLGLQRGVTGYCYHTVPVALYAWLRHFGDYRASLEAVLNCGGDTDTAGAITGALAAINAEIEPEWVRGIKDYPISVGYLRKLAAGLETKKEGNIGLRVTFPWWAMPARNLVFLTVVLAHGFRRLIPL